VNALRLTPLDPAKLNARQRENYHFQKLSAVLADYGFQTMRLSDDWNGADFIAQHIDGMQFLAIQLKGRLLVDKKYIDRNLWIAFPDPPDWYLYPHDEILQFVLEHSNVANTDSWAKGTYSFPSIPKWMEPGLAPYRIRPASAVPIPK